MSRHLLILCQRELRRLEKADGGDEYGQAAEKRIDGEAEYRAELKRLISEQEAKQAVPA